jgi:hypothetical protein
MSRRLGFGVPRPFDAADEIDTEHSRQADDGWDDRNQMTPLGITLKS